MKPSLHLRLVVAAGIVLVAFLSLTAIALDRAFRDSAELALRERLQAHVYALIAAAEVDAAGDLRIPPALPESRFNQPASGLYAQIVGGDTRPQWQSLSLLGGADIPVEGLGAGEWSYRRTNQGADGRVLQLGLGIEWEDERGTSHPFSFWVAENERTLLDQVDAFRRSLALWFGAGALLLLLLQGLILRWSLAPIRRVERDLRAVEAGEHARLIGDYPRELSGLTGNLNALLDQQGARLARYRDALADLAHSLKTPLAVLRNQLSLTEATQGSELADSVREQTLRMDHIVQYQLQRAATAGRSALTAPVALAPLLQRICNGLAKVYRDKSVHFELNVSSDLEFRGDEGDLMELAGNLLDNAAKWCRGQVRVHASASEQGTRGPRGLDLVVEDDGPGIEAQLRDQVLARGRRADESVEGQGIGLSVVGQIVEAYAGSLRIEDSELGGARIQMRLPGPRDLV